MKICFVRIREEYRLRVFENRVLREIFGPERGKVTGYWRKLHSEVLGGLYYTKNIIRLILLSMLRWAEHVARMGRRKIPAGLWWKKLSKKDSLKI